MDTNINTPEKIKSLKNFYTIKDGVLNNKKYHIIPDSYQSSYGPGKHTVLSIKIEDTLYECVNIERLNSIFFGTKKKQPGTLSETTKMSRIRIKKGLYKQLRKYCEIAVKNGVSFNDMSVRDGVLQKLYNFCLAQYNMELQSKIEATEITKQIANIQTAINVNTSLGIDTAPAVLGKLEELQNRLYALTGDEPSSK